jgi:CheY-like chemotaxis protein
MSPYKRILVVDNDERVLFVMRGALMRLGAEYDVVTVRSGGEALEEFRKGSFDLVITDLKMSDMDGIELTEAIQALDSGAVVVWITAYGCHGVRAEARELGVYCCQDKPLEIADIRRVVLEALESTGSQGATTEKQ